MDFLSQLKQVVSHALRLATEGRAEEATAMVSAMLSDDLTVEQTVQVFAHRSLIHECLQQYDDAASDLRRAHAMTHTPTDTRFGIELGLASNAAARGNTDEQVAWLREATRTAAADQSISGLPAAQRLILVVGEDALTDEDRDACSRIFKAEWTRYGAEGDSDSVSLRESLEALLVARRNHIDALKRKRRR